MRQIVAGRKSVWARTIIVGGLALLASWQVVKVAVVSAYADERPEVAEQVWSSHPQVNLALAMAEIGGAAAAGQSVVPVSALRRTQRASIGAPLAVEPFLIKGALAKTARREDLAERLFVEARSRDPRSAAARYFLAERYLTSGRPTEGLREVSSLARLVPQGSRLISPGLVQYARAPGSAPHLRRMFAANPQVGLAVLTELAADAANADLIMRIAEPTAIGDAPAPAWQGKLLNALVASGEFSRAQKLWSRVSGIRPPNPPGAVNQGFAKINAPPPFNWTLGSGSFGVAEPEAGGKLKAIFYGREDADLASQLLLLPAGQYQIRMTASSDAAESSGLEWSVTCVPGKARLAAIALKRATVAAKTLSGTFTVPRQGCAAQWVKLTGTAEDIAKSEEATIGDFDVSPVVVR